ncbi:MAG: alpha/beta hydrolase [Blautia wexlerae]
MSIFASILRSVYKLSGAKKAFALPEDALRKEIEKQNRHRGVFTPTDRKAYYETIAVNGFPCLIVREHPKPSERAILYFFGGGMVIGPDKGDLPVMRKLCRETGCDVWFPFYPLIVIHKKKITLIPGCDVWFPFYPLCMEYCITETYAMVYECYRKMIGLYGGGNVSTCGFSSGGALALGIAAHNNAQPEPLPQPRHIVVVSPGEVPWNDAERARMQALDERDVSIDYAFMVTVEKFMRHGCENVPDYMLSGSRGDFTGVGDIHFFYSADEVLYGALPDFEEACKRANVPYTVSARPKMVHCYCMLPIFKEAKEDFAKIVDILKK